jgi:hypothetical protein
MAKFSIVGTFTIGICTRETDNLSALPISLYTMLSMAKDTETELGKDLLLPPAPKKSFLDGALNRLARTIAQIRTGHWLCAPYLKRTRKNRDDEVSDRCWWCRQWRMSRTHVFLRCMHPSLERARKEIWD